VTDGMWACPLRAPGLVSFWTRLRSEWAVNNHPLHACNVGSNKRTQPTNDNTPAHSLQPARSKPLNPVVEGVRISFDVANAEIRDT
jgi:hypothetical protein